MVAAAVTVNWTGIDRTCPNMRREVVHVTTAATGDWYDATDFTTIVACNVSPNYAIAAADAVGVTFATNRVTFALVAGAAAQDYTLEIYGVN